MIRLQASWVRAVVDEDDLIFRITTSASFNLSDRYADYRVFHALRFATYDRLRAPRSAIAAALVVAHGDQGEPQ